MTEPPNTATTSGTLRGCVEDGLYVFRGMPYAAPPVGPGRWKAARPHPGWDHAVLVIGEDNIQVATETAKMDL